MMDLAAAGAMLAIGATIIGALWRVGSVGKAIGEKMSQLATEVASLNARVGHLEVAKASAEARHLAAVETELAELRKLTPRPVRRQAGLP
jgi:outer membrane murein-binding lipoprotein Lpp